MSIKKQISIEEAKQIGEKFGITWENFNVEQFKLVWKLSLNMGLPIHLPMSPMMIY